MPDQYTKYTIDEDGGVQDPPVVASFERELSDAMGMADEAQIQEVTDRYAERRHKIAKAHNDKVDQRNRDDERILREEDARRRAELADERERASVNAERARAQELRDNPPTPADDPNAGKRADDGGNALAAPLPTPGMTEAGNDPKSSDPT